MASCCCGAVGLIAAMINREKKMLARVHAPWFRLPSFIIVLMIYSPNRVDDVISWFNPVRNSVVSVNFGKHAFSARAENVKLARTVNAIFQTGAYV